MTETNAGSIALEVLDEVNTNLGSGVITSMANNNIQKVKNLTNSSTFVASHVPAVLHYTIADVCSREALNGAKADWSIGDVRVNEGAAINSLRNLARYHTEEGDKALEMLRSKALAWKKVNG